MKNCISHILFSSALLLFISCSPAISEVRPFIEERINRSGNFDVTVISVAQAYGERFQHKRTGQNMYALEFIATVQTNRDGYILIQKDGMVRNLNIFSYEPNDILQRGYLNIAEIRHVREGDKFEIRNKVILEKKNSGWNTVALRWDLY